MERWKVKGIIESSRGLNLPVHARCENEPEMNRLFRRAGTTRACHYLQPRNLTTSRARGRPTLFLYQQTLNDRSVCAFADFYDLCESTRSRRSRRIGCRQSRFSTHRSFDWLARPTTNCLDFDGRETQRGDLGADIFFGYLAV